jgi:hypothetical protein
MLFVKDVVEAERLYMYPLYEHMSLDELTHAMFGRHCCECDRMCVD